MHVAGSSWGRETVGQEPNEWGEQWVWNSNQEKPKGTHQNFYEKGDVEDEFILHCVNSASTEWLKEWRTRSTVVVFCII